MNTIDTIVTILATGYFLYNYLIYKKYGNLNSVSASYYQLQKTRKGGYFQAFIIFLFACLLAIAGHSNHTGSWAFFLAAAGGAFVYAASNYNQDKITELVHISGAGTLIVSSLLGVGLVYGSWLGAYIMAALFIYGTGKSLLFKLGWVKKAEVFKNDGLWYEHIATAVIIIFLYIR
jgi:hypothetical protein